MDAHSLGDVLAIWAQHGQRAPEVVNGLPAHFAQRYGLVLEKHQAPQDVGRVHAPTPRESVKALSMPRTRITRNAS